MKCFNKNVFGVLILNNLSLFLVFCSPITRLIYYIYASTLVLILSVQNILRVFSFSVACPFARYNLIDKMLTDLKI